MSKRLRKFVVYVMIISMLLSTLIAGASFFI